MLQLVPGGGLKEVVEDTSPVLGGHLDGGGFNISNVGTGTFAKLVVDGDTLVVDPANHNVFIGMTSPPASPAGKLDVIGSAYPIIRGTRTSTSSSTYLTAAGFVHKTTANMVNGFGVTFDFAIIDSSGVRNAIASFGAQRDGADNSGQLNFGVKNAGSWNLRAMVIKPNGRVGIGDITPACKLEVNGAIASDTVIITASSDVLDVSGVNHVFVNISADIVLGGLVGGVDGQVVTFALIGNFVNHCTFEHREGIGGSTQDFVNHTSLDEDVDHGGCIYLCNGTQWFDVSHARHV